MLCVVTQGDSLLRRGGSGRGRGRGGYAVATAGGNIVRIRDNKTPATFEFDQVNSFNTRIECLAIIFF